MATVEGGCCATSEGMAWRDAPGAAASSFHFGSQRWVERRWNGEKNLPERKGRW